jgi:hypothetical protein
MFVAWVEWVANFTCFITFGYGWEELWRASLKIVSGTRFRCKLKIQIRQVRAISTSNFCPSLAEDKLVIQRRGGGGELGGVCVCPTGFLKQPDRARSLLLSCSHVWGPIVLSSRHLSIRISRIFYSLVPRSCSTIENWAAEMVDWRDRVTEGFTLTCTQVLSENVSLTFRNGHQLKKSNFWDVNSCGFCKNRTTSVV